MDLHNYESPFPSHKKINYALVNQSYEIKNA